MPRDPQTGQFVSQEVYDAIVAEEGEPNPQAYPHNELPPVRYVERPRSSPLNAILLLAVIGMGGFIVWQSTRAAVGPVPIVVPDHSVDTLVAPIKAKLAQDPAKATKVFQAYSGLRDALAGASGTRVADTRVFAAVTTALLNDIDAAGGIPIGGDIDRAVATHLGISWGRDGSDGQEGWEFKKFGPDDRAKLVEIIGAIARSGGGTVSSVARTEQLAHEYFRDQAYWLSKKDIFSSPEKIEQAYATKVLIGAVTDDAGLPHDLRQFARNCRDEFRSVVGRDRYRFATAPGTGEMHGDYQGQLCLHFQHYLKIDRAKAYRGAQLTGDCVSWSKRTMRDQARCYDIGHLNQAEEYVKRSATADLYSMRGHTGAGASPSRLALVATKIGILLETPVESPEGEVWDFSDYKSYYRLGMKHGRNGFPQWIFDLNREHGPKQVAEINTPEELLTALWNGCGVGVGSMIGVSKSGGKDGVSFVSPLQGSWPHDMAIVGFDDTRQHHRETLILWDQSWGKWNRIEGWPAEYGQIPEGLFCLTVTDTMRAIRQGECHALSDSHGFRPRRQKTLGAEGLI